MKTEKVKKFFDSAKRQFLLAQAIIYSMISTVAFCSQNNNSAGESNIFTNIDNKMRGYVSSIAGLAFTCVAFFGICSGILYVSTSNERTAEKAKSWAIRCVVAMVAIFLFQTAKEGTLYEAIQGLISI